MVQRLDVRLVDDIDGSEAVETVEFALDGTSYEIDLSEVHAKELREALLPFTESGRRDQPARKRKKKAEPVEPVRVPPAEIRAWALENGYDVPARGRVPLVVCDAYYAATA